MVNRDSFKNERGHTSKQGMGTHLRIRKGDTSSNKECPRLENVPDGMSPIYECPLINEQELTSLIDACHRTIDWSIGLYFKALKKGIGLFAEKMVKDDKITLYDAFTTFLLNDIEIAQLINDIEEHINHEVVTIQNKCLPSIKFSNLDVIPSFDFSTELINEQKTTIKLSQQVEKTVCQLTTKALLNFNPSFIPKRLTAKTNSFLGKSMTRVLVMDPDSHCHHFKEIIKKQVTGLLEDIEQFLNKQLKYQLAEQLYNWFDQYEF